MIRHPHSILTLISLLILLPGNKAFANPPPCTPKASYMKATGHHPEDIQEAMQEAWEYFNKKSKTETLVEYKVGEIALPPKEVEWQKKRAKRLATAFPRADADKYFEFFYLAYCEEDYKKVAQKAVNALINESFGNRADFLRNWFNYLAVKKQIPPDHEIGELEYLTSYKNTLCKRCLQVTSQVATGGRMALDQVNKLKNKDPDKRTINEEATRPCEPKHNTADLHPDGVKPHQHFENPRDQDGTGWCVANSLADMITHRLGHKVSALALAKTFQDEATTREEPPPTPRLPRKNKAAAATAATAPAPCEYVSGPPISVGCTNATLLFKAAIKKGVCREDEVHDWEHPLTSSGSDSEDLTRWGGFDRMDRTARGYGIGEYIKGHCEATFQQSYSHLLAGNEAQIMAVVEHQNKLLASRMTECKNRYALDPEKFEVEQERVGPQTMAKLNTQLDRGEVVGLGIGSGFLYTSDPARVQNFYGKFDGDHNVLIVGRQKINGKCGYYLRNSWGIGCDPRFEAPDVTCKDGELWVSESRLLLMADRTIMYKNPR